MLELKRLQVAEICLKPFLDTRPDEECMSNKVSEICVKCWEVTAVIVTYIEWL